MTGKADFTEEEWTLLREAPTSAGMLVIQSDRGGSIRETFSMAKAYTDARKEHGASTLLDDIVSEKPEVDRTRFGSEEEAPVQPAPAHPRFRRPARAEGDAGGARGVSPLHHHGREPRRGSAPRGIPGDERDRVSDDERQALTEIAEAAGASESA